MTRASSLGLSPNGARLGVYAVLACILVAAYAVDRWPAGHMGTGYLALHFALTIAMVLAWASPRISVRELMWAAIILRLSLIPVQPFSSNDFERYLWDGAVALAGFDPYSVAADNPAVTNLREIWATPEEHAKYPTLYPPSAIALFAVSALAGPEAGMWVWKLIAGMAGIASLVLMRAVLDHHGKSRHFALVALSPLLLLETGIGAHLDSLLVLSVALMLYTHAKSRWIAMGVALGFGISLKLLPLILLAPMAFALSRRAFVQVLLAAMATVAAIYLTAMWMGHVPIGILSTFFEKWRHTSPVYSAIEWAFDGGAILIAIAALGAFGLLLSCLIARRNLAVSFAIALAVPLLLSPVVFPWYLMALVPLVAMRPSATLLLWLTTVPLSYVVLNRWLAEGVWEPAVWPIYVIAGGWIVGLLIDQRFLPDDGGGKEQTEPQIFADQTQLSPAE